MMVDVEMNGGVVSVPEDRVQHYLDNGYTRVESASDNEPKPVKRVGRKPANLETKDDE